MDIFFLRVPFLYCYVPFCCYCLPLASARLVEDGTGKSHHHLHQYFCVVFPQSRPHDHIPRCRFFGAINQKRPFPPYFILKRPPQALTRSHKLSQALTDSHKLSQGLTGSHKLSQPVTCPTETIIDHPILGITFFFEKKLKKMELKAVFKIFQLRPGTIKNLHLGSLYRLESPKNQNSKVA